MTDGTLEDRYTITRKDGKPIDPRKKYLVLELSDPDEREFAGITAFANACNDTGYSELCESILAAIGTWRDVPPLHYDLPGEMMMPCPGCNMPRLGDWCRNCS